MRSEGPRAWCGGDWAVREEFTAGKDGWGRRGEQKWGLGTGQAQRRRETKMSPGGGDNVREGGGRRCLKWCSNKEQTNRRGVGGGGEKNGSGAKGDYFRLVVTDCGTEKEGGGDW